MIDGTKDAFDENCEPKDAKMNYDRNNVINYIFAAGYNGSDGQRAHRISRLNGAFRGEQAKIVEVDVDKIHPCQPFIDAAKVIAIFYCLKRNERLQGYPTGLLLGEDFYLLDGHHRASAQIMYGRKKIEVMATEITQDDWDGNEIRNPMLAPMNNHGDNAEYDKLKAYAKIIKERFNGSVHDFVIAKYNNEI